MPHERRGDKLAVDVDSGRKTAFIRSMYKYIYINKYQVRCGLVVAGSTYCMVVIYFGKKNNCHGYTHLKPQLHPK